MNLSIKVKLGAIVFGLTGIIFLMFLVTWVTTSNQKDDGLVINLAGRQRMLSQKITKETLHFVTETEKLGNPNEELAGQVRSTMNIFNTTLNALKESGRAPLSLSMSGEFRRCPKAEEPAYSQLAKVKDIWVPFQSRISSILEHPNPEDVAWIMQNNTVLLAEMNKAVGMMQKQSEGKISLLLTLQIIGVIIGLVFFSLAAKIVLGITKRLSSISDFSEHMSAGDFTFSIEESGSNELEDIINELNETTTNVGKMIGSLKHKTGELDTAAQDLNGFSHELLESASNLNERAVSTAAASEEMSVNMSTVSNAVNQTGKNIQVISSNTTELSATVTEISQNTESARNITSEAVQSVAFAADKVSELNESAKGIGQVIDSIIEISEQTKLLALNATIEAARAGEAGKGFAVVANEVKELAAQTNNATEEIRDKISTMQNSTKDTINQIHNITEVIDNVNEIVNTIASAVEEQSITTRDIADNIGRTTEATTEMTNNVSQAAEVSGMIAADAAGVNEASTQVNSVSTKMAENAQTLSGVSKEIQEMVSAFRF